MLAYPYGDMMTYYSNLRRIDDIPCKEDTINGEAGHTIHYKTSVWER